MNYATKRSISHLVFAVLIIGSSLFYNFHEILFKRPQSIHTWRQTDGASVALNYSREGMNFFQPSFHNLTSDGGTSGKSATSEMPLLYYTVAFLYIIFGQHEFIFRLLNMLIFFTGLFYLFKTIKLEFNDFFWAVAIPLFFFTSPVLVYYTNNFLPNSTAFSMVLIGWHFAFRYFKNQKRKDLVKMFLFFLLAGALKITALFSFFALGGIFVLEWSGLINFNKEKKIFQRPGFTITAGFLMLLPIIAWIMYAKYYNHIHDSTYFSTVLFPIWDLEPGTIEQTINTVNKLWLPEYFHPVSLIFLGILFLINLVFAGRIKKFYTFILLFLSLEIIVYVLLQFYFFRDHDYYTINIYILPVFILISSLSLLKSFNLSRQISLVIKILFLGFLGFNFLYAGNRMDERYNGWMNDIYRNKKNFYTLEPHLRDIGIKTEDRVISFSDYSHVSLYLMDQKGWSRFSDMRLHREDPVRYNNDSSAIQRSIDRGAKYLIINGFKDLYQNPYLDSYTRHLKSVYRNILIFEPENPIRNFEIRERKVKAIAWSSAELLSEDSSSIVDSTRTFSFQNVETRNNEAALTGKYSLKLFKENPYGFSIRLENMHHGESVKINVWKKGDDTPGIIVAQTEDYNRFNRIGSELTGNRKGEWVEMELEFFIPFDISEEDIKIYLYNPEEKEVYFDDFRIIRYKKSWSGVENI